MNRLLVPFLILSAVAPISAAEVKFGVVDMVKAFNEFYKTKDASVVLQEKANKVKEEIAERTNSYKKLLEEADKLDKERRDPVLGPDARAKKDAELQAKTQELRAADREMQEFQQRRKGQLDQEAMEKRRGLYEEISKAVQNKAKGANLDLVIDKSSTSVSGMPMFLYLKEGALPDLTAEVIVELNKDAPAGSATPAPAPPKATPAESAPEPKPKKKKSSQNN